MKGESSVDVDVIMTRLLIEGEDMEGLMERRVKIYDQVFEEEGRWRREEKVEPN
jgi:hypothetical protein